MNHVLRRLCIPFLLLAAACGGDTGSAGPPQIGDPLPPLSGRLLDGDSVALAEYRGSPVLVNLWATWCAPCREEMPYLESVAREYADRGLRVVGISTDHQGATDQVRSVVAERGVTYDILLDTRARSMDLFGVFGLPVTYIADAEGVVTFARRGPLVEGDAGFKSALDQVTAGRSPDGALP